MGNTPKKLFWEDLNYCINESRFVKSQTSIIFIDKNHPVEAVDGTVRNIKK